MEFLNPKTLHFNWVDLAFFALVVYYLLSNKGFMRGIVDLMSFVFSLVLSYKFYVALSSVLLSYFSLSKGVSNVIAFALIWFLIEFLIQIGIISLLETSIEKFEKYSINYILGFSVAIVEATIIFLLFITLLFSFPVQGKYKQNIFDSQVGPTFVDVSRRFEKNVKSVFGDAILETINFLTIKPGSKSTVNLDFKISVDKLTIDPQSEKQMLQLVNEERRKDKKEKLRNDDGLKEVAREYAREMFVHGFFSHTSRVDGSTGADRVKGKGIVFFVVGENLAFAPDVYLAHQGLMNSEGHRKNILSPEYSRVGIGVIDGGVYGKMFVQVFVD